MRVFITGIAGFLGSSLAHRLESLGHDVVGCDDMSGGDFENLPESVREKSHRQETGTPTGVKLNINVALPNSFNHLVKLIQGSEVVYHCAAAAYEGVSVFSPAHVSQNVYGGAAAVFSAAAACRVRRVVSCSSMSRYGAGKPPFEEWHACHPVDPYGLAKLGADRLLAQVAETHKFEYSVAVPHNIYGPRQRFDDPYRNVAAIMANRALRGLPPVVYGDGSQVRCFSYVDDVVDPLVLMATEPRAAGEVINVGPEAGATTVLDLAKLILNITGLNKDPIFYPPRPREVHRATCAATKARLLLGYEPRTALADGMRKLVEHVEARGPRPFRYHLGIEIQRPETPRTWLDQLI